MFEGITALHSLTLPENFGNAAETMSYMFFDAKNIDLVRIPENIAVCDFRIGQACAEPIGTMAAYAELQNAEFRFRQVYGEPIQQPVAE